MIVKKKLTSASFHYFYLHISSPLDQVWQLLLLHHLDQEILKGGFSFPEMYCVLQNKKTSTLSQMYLSRYFKFNRVFIKFQRPSLSLHNPIFYVETFHFKKSHQNLFLPFRLCHQSRVFPHVLEKQSRIALFFQNAYCVFIHAFATFWGRVLRLHTNFEEIISRDDGNLSFPKSIINLCVIINK
jgi:hypothetical protein